MQALRRTARFAAVGTGAVVLWGLSTACETDNWHSDRRVTNAPASSADQPAGSELPNVSVGDRAEADLAQEMMLHRAMYARYLSVLATYYSEHGYENKAGWARTELRDLRQVHPYGVESEGTRRGPSREQMIAAIESPAGVELPRIVVANRNEVDLLEDMMLHRSMYPRYLRALLAYCSEHGEENKANTVRTELNDFGLVKPYQYITETEVPGGPMKPLESIAEADQLFQQGMDLMDKGGHHVIIYYSNTTMKQALAKFREVIDKYPTSDKIDDAAYFIGEIHKEYNQERDNEIAIEWYKKAIAWNADLPYPAWSHVAHIYDFRMHEREKALEWYQKVLDNEKGKTGWRFWKNIDVANKRIAELTGEKTRHSPSEMAGESDRPSGPPEPVPDTGLPASQPSSVKVP